jgi:hypothetical protein
VKIAFIDHVIIVVCLVVVVFGLRGWISVDDDCDGWGG